MPNIGSGNIYYPCDRRYCSQLRRKWLKRIISLGCSEKYIFITEKEGYKNVTDTSSDGWREPTQIEESGEPDFSILLWRFSCFINSRAIYYICIWSWVWKKRRSLEASPFLKCLVWWIAKCFIYFWEKWETDSKQMFSSLSTRRGWLILVKQTHVEIRLWKMFYLPDSCFRNWERKPKFFQENIDCGGILRIRRELKRHLLLLFEGITKTNAREHKIVALNHSDAFIALSYEQIYF